MFKLDTNIQALLYQYDCVVIPEFGGFVANYKPSQIKKDTHFIYPPSKVLSFNKNLRANDGLLAKDISVKKAITFEEANQEIKEIVEDYFTLLNNGHRIEFEKVGILYFDKNKNILFDPFNNCNFLLDSFGLEAFFAPKAKKIKEINEIKQTFSREETKIVSTQGKIDNSTLQRKEIENVISLSTDLPKIKHHSNWKKYAVAAVGFLMIAYAGAIAYKTDFRNPKYIFKSELNPIRPSTKHKYFSRWMDATPIENEDSAGEDSANISLAGIIFDTLTEDSIKENGEAAMKNEAASNNLLGNNSNGKYFVVGGCFRNFDNAKNYYSSLEKKGFDAEILERHNGLYPVVYGSYSTKIEAQNAQAQIIKSEPKNAWILKR